MPSKSKSLPNIKKQKDRIPSSINVNSQIEDNTSIASSEDTSLGSMIDYELEMEGIAPKTSGGNDSISSKEEEKKLSPKEAAAQRNRQVEYDYFNPKRDYSPIKYPEWGEIEWEGPIHLQRTPSLDIFKDLEPPKQEKKQEAKKPPIPQGDCTNR